VEGDEKLDHTAELATIGGEDEGDEEDHPIGSIVEDREVATEEMVVAEVATGGMIVISVTEVRGETGGIRETMVRVAMAGDGVIVENFGGGGGKVVLVIQGEEAIIILLNHPPADGVLGVLMDERMVAGVVLALTEAGRKMSLVFKVSGQPRAVVGQLQMVKSRAGVPPAQLEVEVGGMDLLIDGVTMEAAKVEAAEVAGKKVWLPSVRFINLKPSQLLILSNLFTYG